MKTQVLIAIAVALIGASVSSAQAAQLTQNQQDACAAIMCMTYAGLSAANKVAECGPPIEKYNRVWGSSPQNKHQNQRRWLAQCPFNESGNDSELSAELAKMKGALITGVKAGGGCNEKSVNVLTSEYRGEVDENGVGRPTVIVRPFLPVHCQWNASGYRYDADLVWDSGHNKVHGKWLPVD